MRTLLQKLEESLKQKEKELTKFFLFSFIFYTALTFVFFFPYVHIIGSLDTSMPHRFYLWIRPSEDPEEKDAQIRKRRYVEVYVGDLTQYPPIREKGVLYLIKKAVCFPGDFLAARGGEFYCNGKLIAVAYPEAPVPPISYDGRIPEGRYFVLGIHPASFDSRYMGLVSLDRITGVLIPLF
ncbi:MAG TPA: hypothetical protein ENJ61_00310 [Aquifex aeolicus]|uniref:Peptidase S26 domain-containing protein n=1 Tax=Aquifex aeolicus TaxID=63363 RepID=A0A7C5L651_AQUAO|nr:hypothetical protein [Aquifex aeolicus]